MRRSLALLATLVWLAQPVYAQTITPGGGGGGTPGGANTQLQYNNNGAFGGLSTATTDGTNITLTGNLIGSAGSSTVAGVASGTNQYGLSEQAAALEFISQGVFSALIQPSTGGRTPGLGLGSTGGVFWSSVASPYSTYDTYLTRGAAATVQFGPADAAAPTAQNVSVQNVVAGTSNTAGVNFTIQGSKGTGTGAGGSLIFQTAPAGTTGTAQNAEATVLTLDSTGLATLTGPIYLNSNGTKTATLIRYGSNGANYGVYTQGSGAWDWSFNSTPSIELNSNGPAEVLGSTWGLWWSSGSDVTVNAADLFLTRAAAATLRMGKADAAAPVAQSLVVQNVVAGTSNTAGTNFTISGSQGTGTGAGGSIILRTAPAGTTGTAQNAEVNAVSVDQKQHIALGTTAPVVSACGTTPGSVTGSDSSFHFATGTGSPTSCTITFANSGYTGTPTCVVEDGTARANLTAFTVSTTAITLTITGSGGDTIEAVCFGN